MAQIPIRLTLQSMTFPLLTELAGRTIIDPSLDQTFVPGVSVAADQTQVPVDRGTPQIYYCHNVMPSTQGYQSVGFDVEYAGIEWGELTPGAVSFTSAILIQGAKVATGDVVESTSFPTYISAPRIGTNAVFVLDQALKKWKPVLGAPTIAEGTRITAANVNGVSYIYFSNIGCYIYNNETNTLVQRTLTGLEEATITGLVSSNGYLIAYSPFAIAWSSVVNVEDFVISDVSGAGGGQVQEAKGQIISASATALGFILFTTGNAVSVIYSGNADFPWNLKGIPSSGGVASANLVSEEQAGGYLQVYSTNGLQQIGHAGARTILPYITDFIEGSTFEDFNINTLEFTQEELTENKRKNLAVIADRYSLISYGRSQASQLTHVLVMDMAQNRLGKLKLAHSYAFELRSLSPGTTESPRGTIAFLQPNGTVQSVNFNSNTPAPDAVLLLGKFQYVRQRMLELFSVEMENIKAGAGFSVQALATLDGKNTAQAINGYPLETSKNYRKYSFIGAVGTNVSTLLTGRFNLISALLWFGVHGRP